MQQLRKVRLLAAYGTPTAQVQCRCNGCGRNTQQETCACALRGSLRCEPSGELPQVYVIKCRGEIGAGRLLASSVPKHVRA
jgi:hypothetical protein